MSRQKTLIAFTLYEGMSPLDVVGPLTVLRKVGDGHSRRLPSASASRG